MLRVLAYKRDHNKSTCLYFFGHVLEAYWYSYYGPLSRNVLAYSAPVVVISVCGLFFVVVDIFVYYSILPVRFCPVSFTVSAFDLFEYQWPQDGGDWHMLQEQISEFLKVKSFKRKYPGRMQWYSSVK